MVVPGPAIQHTASILIQETSMHFRGDTLQNGASCKLPILALKSPVTFHIHRAHRSASAACRSSLQHHAHTVQQEADNQEPPH